MMRDHEEKEGIASMFWGKLEVGGDRFKELE